MLSKKIGIVYFVGMAARFVTSAIAIATIADIKSTMLVPARTTVNIVIGASTHPCAVSAILHHSKRFSCWFVDQSKNLLTIEVFDLSLV